MDKAFRDVLAFHEKFGCHIGSTPAVPPCDVEDLRVSLIEEETDELCDAMCDRDIPAIADAIVDLIYVLIGAAIAYGIDIRPLWEAVHEANMAKEGSKRPDGKVLKGPDWVPPDVEGILASQQPIEGSK